jgi:hypothetical protein
MSSCVAQLSAVDLVVNLQAMNRTFSSFALVNTYGAFGSVGRQRPELILQVSRDILRSFRPSFFAHCMCGDPGDEQQ